MASLPGTLPVLGVIAIIFSAMYFGWATPTEAGAVGAFVVFVAAVIRRMKWRELQETLLDTAKLTVMIFSLIWGVLIRSEEHTSELQSLMRISYAVFCLKKKNNNTKT